MKRLIQLLSVTVVTIVVFTGCKAKEINSYVENEMSNTVSYESSQVSDNKDSSENVSISSEISKRVSSVTEKNKVSSKTDDLKTKKNDKKSNKNNSSFVSSNITSSNIVKPQTINVSVSIDCINAYNLGNSTAKLISDNGVMFSQKLTLKSGATVYDALKAAEAANSRMLVGASTSALGVYVYSIGSLAEKAEGAESGWLFLVNGKLQSASCSSYLLNDNDSVRWRYTCNGGGDVN